MHTIKVSEGVNLHIYKTSKFKDVSITVRFADKITKTNASHRQLLGVLMSDRCSLYDTKEKMQYNCDMFYGANIISRVSGYGKLHILDLQLQFLNEKFTSTIITKRHKRQFEFMQEMIFKPLLNDECFDEAKKLAIERIERTADEPSSYATDKLFTSGACSSPLSINARGSLDVIGKCTLQDIEDEHKKLLLENMVDIFVVGDVNVEEITNYVQEFLNFKGQVIEENCYYLNEEIYSKHVESKNIQQTIVCELYRTNINVKDDDFWSLRVLDYMLGGSAVSLLFQQVREKRSLCYSIYSTLISYDGALVVQTGINKENTELVIELITEQIKRLQEGDFSDELLTTCKDMICNSFNTLEDRVMNIVGLQYQNILLQRNLDIDDMVQAINYVNKESIIKVASLLQKQCTFVLEQGG